MRITCPGCGAAYEVPDRAVPDPGRDVQCAGCGASWFLLKGGAMAPAAEPGAAPPAGQPGRNAPGDAGDAAATGVAGRGDAAAPRQASEADRNGLGAARDRADDAGHTLDELPPRRRVDPEVLAILRAEAETERRARAAAAADARRTAVDGPPPDAPAAEHGPVASGPAGAEMPGAAGTGAHPWDGAAPFAEHGPPPDTLAPARGPGAADGVTPDAPQRSGPAGAMADGGGPAGETAEAGHTPPDAPGRLARLAAAERQATGGRAGSISGAWVNPDGSADDALVEDPDPARHGPRPPLLAALPATPPPGTGTGGSAPGLPMVQASPDHRALVTLQRRRRGFRFGFAATAGLCIAALAVYLVALRAGTTLDGPLLDAVLHHGGQVQAALVDWLRRVVVPALS